MLSYIVEDILNPTVLTCLAALLDYEVPQLAASRLVPLAHWLHFHPSTRQSELGPDGHPYHSALLPPDLPPRRMWGESKIRFEAPLSMGSSITRRTRLLSISQKAGSSGPLVLVTLGHRIYRGSVTAVSEEQCLVYREASAQSAPSEHDARMRPTPEQADFTRMVTLDATALFRFSALTYNTHRIHYDRDYATQIEHYPGLVVQGPFLATLLMDHFLRHHPDSQIAFFNFRARMPVFADQLLALQLKDRPGGARLWVENDGRVVMTAEIGVAD